ncbi:hypothetical protein EIN_224160 [Entamoeba invadens IP1]|uniref:U3 small nucleolar RNA-associated protein 11 n=1 Tax=Entamoeba invadens IP1 TaxID=370355 RepID=A0A0A1U867_ENTIV|nr:hypothetical protein EIN_224160 [Entamoeba invadens IP1]ELP88173.1 hypothetical protein EIN_224160 [Entamoeba invadens IP1]|eukprot:XP_004254944.1 hypothetical protein EIN_224160 [Entamoeba invadens IP1]
MGRNPYNQTVHKERKQPNGLKGTLQRRKDFIHRSRIKKLQNETKVYLQRQATLKNPDEYSSKMDEYVIDRKKHRMVRRDENDAESIKDLEHILMVKKNALLRLQKRLLFHRSKTIVYNKAGVPEKVEPCDLIDVTQIYEKIDVSHELERKEAVEEQIKLLKQDIRKTEQTLLNSQIKAKENDKRKKYEAKTLTGDIIATVYQTPRKR